MRTPVWLVLLLVTSLLLGAGAAEARRSRKKAKKKPSRAAPPAVAVVPFEGNKQGKALARSLGLELELVETVQVTNAAKLAADLKKKKARAFEAATLKAAMKKRKVDIVIRGVAGWDDEGTEVWHLIAYASDGEPRLQAPVPMSKDADETAQKMAERLGPVFKSWSSQTRVELVFPKKPKPKSDADLFVDPGAGERRIAGADEESGKKKKRKSKALEEIRREKKGDRDSAPDEDLDEDTSKKGRSDRAIADEPKTGKKRLDDKAEEKGKDEEKEPSLSHLIAVSMGPEASFWLYHFLANEKVQGEGYPFYKFFPSGGLRISFWPIEWVGVDADVRGGLVRFSANTGVSVEGGLPFRGLPIGLDGNGREQFLSFKGAAGVAAKARYILHLGNLGVGGGMRLGYRYHAHYAADQYFLDNDRITLIPSYQWHNVALGPELFFSAILFGRRLEVEPKLDLMPVTVYIEGPDWPGRRSLTVGANLSAAARMEIFYGAFVEVYGYSTLGYAQWGSLCQYPWVACNGGEGEAGTRRGRLIDPQTGQREFIQGGTVVNLDGGLQVALGWMW